MENTRVKLTVFDDYWFDYRVNAHRRWFEPVYVGCYKDHHYIANVYSAMHYVPEYGKYMLWYEVSPDIMRDSYRLLALAESEDGVHFRPCVVDASREEKYRHIVMEHGGVHGSFVFYDAHDPDPARRFKYAGMTHTEKKLTSVVIETSPDGIHFTDLRTNIAHPYPSDALNSIFYNPYDETYNLVLRSGVGDRRIAMCESRDMKVWSRPRLALFPDPAHNDEMLQTQYYSMAVNYMDGVFYGLLWRYQTSLASRSSAKMIGTMEAELAYSYDGRTFALTTGRPLMTRPDPPMYGCFQQEMMGMTESADHKRYILYGAGQNIIHGMEGVDAKIVERHGGDTGANIFYTIRKDGFCGFEAAYGEGEIVTKAIQLTSDALTLNVNAAGGCARMAILDADTQEPLPGFGYEDNVPLESDETAWKPIFKAHELSELVGRRIRLGVRMTGAILYALDMDAAPCIVKRQASFANPMQIEH